MKNFLIESLDIFDNAGADNLVCLQKTAKLSGKEDEGWLEEAYKVAQKKTAISRYMVSFCNSVVFQRRLVFVLNKRLFGELMRSDENHRRGNRGFDNSKWKEFFFKLCQNEFIEVVRVGKNGEQICRLMHKELVQKIAILTAMDTMTALYESQLMQAIEFIEHDANPARRPAHVGQPAITSPRKKELENTKTETSTTASLFGSEIPQKTLLGKNKNLKSFNQDDLSDEGKQKLLASLETSKVVSDRIKKEKIAQEEKIADWEKSGYPFDKKRI